MDERLRSTRVERYDFRGGWAGIETPSYTHPPQTRTLREYIGEKGPSGRRRKIPPLLATNYLRYEALTSFNADGDVVMKPPGWSTWTRYRGQLMTSDVGQVLSSAGLVTTVSGLGPNCPHPPLSLRSEVENRLLGGIKSQKLDIMTSVAEGRSTLSFLAARSASAVEVARAFRTRDYKRLRNALTAPPPQRHSKGFREYHAGRKGDYIEAKRRWYDQTGRRNLPQDDPAFKTRSLASNWLEYNYAVTPLLLDIHGAAEYAADYITRVQPPVLRSAASSSRPVNKKVSVGTAVQSTARVFYQGNLNGKIDYHHVIYYQVNRDGLRQMSQLGVTNPAATAWELTPFSFLIDWLLPVGEFLQGWDAPLGCALVDGYTLCHLSVLGSLNMQDGNIGPINYGTVLNPGTAEVTYRGFVRRANRVFPYPSPRIKNPFSVRHAATVSALIRNLFWSSR